MGMTDAARRALLVRDGLLAVGEWEVEHGSFNESELETARRRVSDDAFIRDSDPPGSIRRVGQGRRSRPEGQP